jgi:TrmH family RNA methyltransferase
MGALLRFPVFRAADAAEAAEKLTGLGMRVFAALLSDTALDVRSVTLTGGGALVIGNEGSGVSDAAAAVCTDHVIIPMAGRAESLNAAAAGAVLLWELCGKYTNR